MPSKGKTVGLFKIKSTGVGTMGAPSDKEPWGWQLDGHHVVINYFVLGEAYKDNVVLDFAGLEGSKLNAEQKRLLLALIEEYVGNLSEGHAKVRMSEVEEHMDKTYFAWIGGTTSESVYY